MVLPSLDQIHEAQQLVYRYMPPTPQYSWPLINQRFSSGQPLSSGQRLGTEAWIKHENHTPVGAFKLRGALVYANWLKQMQPALAGVVAATRGNFGQGAGMAARLLGMKAVIVVPHGNSACKNAAMLAQGVELIEHGHDFQESLEFARTLAAERGFAMFESFHERLVWGTATYALEFLQAVPRLNVVYVPIGLGSSICGVAAARNALKLPVEIVGVTSLDCRATAFSFKERRIVEAPARTQIADGLACRRPSHEAMEIIWDQVARIVEVPDAEIAEAMRIYFEDTHNLAEGAGAAALAAALSETSKLAGKCAGIVLTGGNVDRDTFMAALDSRARAETPA
jgi:threonine dehydratase